MACWLWFANFCTGVTQGWEMDIIPFKSIEYLNAYKLPSFTMDKIIKTLPLKLLFKFYLQKTPSYIRLKIITVYKEILACKNYVCMKKT